MKHKWSLIYLGAFAMLALLVAMALVGPTASLTLAQDTVQITFANWDDANGQIRHQDAVADFEAAYPYIDVEILPNPAGEDYAARMLTQIATGEMPDVWMGDSSFIPLYAESGGATNLRPYIEDPDVGFDPDEIFYQGAYENGFYQGDPYFLAKDYSTVAIYANASLFEAAGIDLPEEGWTYDDLLDIALLLTVDGNGNNANSPDFDPDNIVQYGMDHRGSWWRGFQSTIYSFGSHTISEDGTTLDGYMNSPETIAALQWMSDAVHVYHVAPSNNWISALPGGVMPLYLEGDIAMVFGMGPWFLGMLEEQPDFEYAILPMPHGPGGHHGAVCWAGFTMSPTSEHPDEAWLLLRALGTEIGQTHYSEHALSAMPAMVESKIGHPFYSTFIDAIDYLDPLDDLTNQYYLLCADEHAGPFLETLFGDEGADVDVEEMTNEVMLAFQDCLDQGG